MKKCFFFLLYILQIIYSNSIYIPNIDVFNIINNASKKQELIQIEKIFDESSITQIEIDNTGISITTTTTIVTPTGTAKPTTKASMNSKKHLPTLIAMIVGACFITILCLTICCCCRRRCRKKKQLKRITSAKPPPIPDVRYRTASNTVSMKDSTPPPTPRKTNNSQCLYMKRAKEYVASLGWKKTLFDSSYDKCYCSQCYSADMSDVTEAGDAKYVIPREWARIGLVVDNAFADQHNIWDKWIVTFHGTTKEAVHSIIADRQFLLPGDTLRDGTILGIREGHIPDKKHVYTSPTIAYSSLDVYSETYQFHSPMNNVDYSVKMVLQCRQQPGTFEVQRETVRAGAKRLCRHISNADIEYFSDRRGTIVAYGLLVKLTEIL